MKKLILIIVFVLPITLIGQQLNQSKIDSKTNESVLIGYCNIEGLQTGNFGKYYAEEYNAYTPDKVIVAELKKANNNIEITIILGTWCNDSKVQVPHFIKILDQIGFNTEDLKIIAVDTDKTAPGISSADLSLRKVPTFIFYRNGEEFGRIIETPFDTLEKDMLKLFIR
jgi:thiol-disulfide isomerase/thioredoxin